MIIKIIINWFMHVLHCFVVFELSLEVLDVKRVRVIGLLKHGDSVSDLIGFLLQFLDVIKGLVMKMLFRCSHVRGNGVHASLHFLELISKDAVVILNLAVQAQDVVCLLLDGIVHVFS